MPAIFNKLIEQLNSSVFVLLGILFCTGWALYKIGKWTEKFQTHEDKITKVEGLAEKVVVMSTKVDLIYDHTLGARGVVAAHSPFTLTDKGKEIADKIKANTILEKYLPKLMGEIDSVNPSNAYDIQMATIKFAKEKMISYLDESELVAVKQQAYENGLLVEDIMAIFGILLRDRVLNKRGLPISDVDKNMPPEDRPKSS
jgi:hypothetical protein